MFGNEKVEINLCGKFLGMKENEACRTKNATSQIALYKINTPPPKSVFSNLVPSIPLC